MAAALGAFIQVSGSLAVGPPSGAGIGASEPPADGAAVPLGVALVDGPAELPAVLVGELVGELVGALVGELVAELFGAALVDAFAEGELLPRCA
jgi:hypothetical protein